jgi:hypothetical protein
MDRSWDELRPGRSADMIGFRQPRGRLGWGTRAATGSWDALVAAVMPAVDAALHRVDEGARDAPDWAGRVRNRAAERSRDAVDALRGKPAGCRRGSGGPSL